MARAGAGFVAKTVTVGELAVRYWEAGATGPTGPAGTTGPTGSLGAEAEAVVYLHPAAGPWWRPAHDRLAETYRVVQYEQPGFGPEPNGSVATLDDQAALLAAAIEATGIERYHLIGTSFGGAVALHLAIGFPDRVVSLVLDAPAAFRHGARSPRLLSPVEVVAAFRTHPEREPYFALPGPEVLARFGPFVERLLGGIDEAALIARMSSCPVRTLVLFGTDDGIIPPDNGRVYRRHLGSSALLYVYDAAHDIMGDRPEAFLDAVGDFLRRGMAFLVPDQDTLINP